MQLYDKDLLSVQEVRDLVEKAKAAQQELAQKSQAEVDAIVAPPPAGYPALPSDGSCMHLILHRFPGCLFFFCTFPLCLCHTKVLRLMLICRFCSALPDIL